MQPRFFCDMIGGSAKHAMDQVQIWKERYDALARWVRDNVTEQENPNLCKCTPGALESVHLGRIKYLEEQIEKYVKDDTPMARRRWWDVVGYLLNDRRRLLGAFSAFLKHSWTSSGTSWVFWVSLERCVFDSWLGLGIDLGLI